jgi:MFS transporter, MHS family, proline/betaine transporter
MNRKTLLTVLAIIFLEWLDFSLYLYLAKSVFATHFFPPSSYSLTLSFALFAAAFLARPLGGWFFGRAADFSGRRIPLMISAALMGISTAGIALLPEYSSVGIWATGGLLVFRIGQGLALGGELNNSAMFLMEHRQQSPLKTGSLVASCGAAGMFVGGVAAALIQTIQVEGLWRIIFLLVGLLSLWVSSLRKKLQESPEFVSNNTPIKQVIREAWGGIVNIALLGAFVGVTVYLCNAYWVSYAIDKQVWNAANCAFAGSIAQLCSALLAYPIARANTPQNTIRLIRCSMLLAVITAPILFFFTMYTWIPGILLGLGLYIITNAFLCAGMYYFLYLQIPAMYRCRVVSTVWALSASLGAISLPLAEAASQHDMDWFAPMWICTIALIAYAILSRGSLKNHHSTGLKTCQTP